MTETTTPTRVIQAEAYVRSRFYPPLPHEYGRLAVEAVDLVNDGQPDATLDVSDLPIQPRGTDADGQVTAIELVSVLRLDHMIETDSLGICGDCDGSGWDAEAYSSRVVYEAEEAACPTCDGTGIG